MSNSKFESIVNDMVSKATQIGRDRNISEAYRTSQIDNLRKQVAQKLSEVGKSEIENLTTLRDQLKKASRTVFAPSANEASQMLYVKSALDAKYQHLDEADRLERLRIDWQNALDADDLITARVFADHYIKYNRDLIDATYDRLLPEETRNAQAELKSTEAELMSIQGDLNGAMIRVEKSQFLPDGTVVDGVTVAWREQSNFGY